MAKPSIWRRVKLWLRDHRRDPLNLRPFTVLNFWADELEDGRKLEPGLVLDREWLEMWVSTGEFGITVEDRRRAAGSF